MAIDFLQQTNAKVSTGGKLSVRDFHMIGSFPLFEGIYQEQRISSMSYAEKVNNGTKLMRALNELVGTAPAAPQQMAAPVAAPQQMAAPVAAPQQAPAVDMFGQAQQAPVGQRTQCVGSVTENTIGVSPRNTRDRPMLAKSRFELDFYCRRSPVSSCTLPLEETVHSIRGVLRWLPSEV